MGSENEFENPWTKKKPYYLDPKTLNIKKLINKNDKDWETWIFKLHFPNICTHKYY
jgi:hypothetical protein